MNDDIKKRRFARTALSFLSKFAEVTIILDMIIYIQYSEIPFSKIDYQKPEEGGSCLGDRGICQFVQQ